jgi:Fe-S-cluster containining protein
MRTPIKISESLSGMLQQMSPKQQDNVSEMITFYYEQYQEMVKENPKDRISVAASIHRAIDQSIESQVKQEKTHVVSCGKGCSFCCFLRVDISNDEAELLTKYAKQKGVKIDYKKLVGQLTNDNDEFMKLSIKERRCVFLSEHGTCNVYEHRPSACRKLIVVSDPSNCDTDTKLGAEVGKLVDLEAEVMMSASLAATKSGSMAEMLIKSKLNK